MRILARVADGIGRGLVAGAIGTAAITAFQMLEMRVRHRPPSTVPAEAAGKALGFHAIPSKKKKLTTAIHWGYGTGWGLLRSLLDAARVPRLAQPLAHFVAVWGAELLMLPRLHVAPKVRRWGGKEIAIDAMRHAAYAAGADAGYLLAAPAPPSARLREAWELRSLRRLFS